VKLLENLYNKVFINIVVHNEVSDVYVEVCSKKTVINSYEETFDTKYLNDEMLSFINSFSSKSPFYYISILDTSPSQGAIPTCSKNELGLYHDMSDCEYKCYKSSWTYYTSKNDLYEIERNYEKIGIDLIYSPFTVLAKFFEDKIDTYMAMYILIQEEQISLGVFKESQLLYAEHICFDSDLEDEELMESEVTIDIEDEGIDLDDVDAIDDIEDIDSLDDFGDIEDLDAIDDIDEFSTVEDIEEELNQEIIKEEISEPNSENFNKEYQIFTKIQKSINTFYKSSKYESEFVENMYIADSVGVSTDLKKYFEEEMFLNVYIRKIMLSIEIADLAKAEVSL